MPSHKIIQGPPICGSRSPLCWPPGVRSSFCGECVPTIVDVLNEEIELTHVLLHAPP